MGKLIKFTTPNQHKRIFIYGSLISPGGPWGDEDSVDDKYDERIIIRDTMGLVLKTYSCNKFDALFYGVLTTGGDMGWVHYKNVEFVS